MALDTEKTLIYVRLLEEGTEVFRPTEALRLGNGLLKILPTPDYDPEDEIWEFQPGAVVRSENYRTESGAYLVAVEAVPQSTS